ncbi:gas vesicle protein GvpG [Micromonospora krabiensis]|uniref:Gas vesicle protein G n=1 Tax=Micromonospora krabiensis TaxID=307121 RepID=A0A1C3N9P9_9ACTN|nr:gas vesicle protein GvpG [Micromonospora krabiensis]SBV29298.1 Gas vesicle protein G [Micromonospora krabiensis]
MDILWTLLTLPYAPVRGLTAVVKVIAREAESQRYNPANIRRELEELDAAAAAGELTAEERDARQQQVLDRLTGGGPRRASSSTARPGSGPERSPGAERGRSGPVVRRRNRGGGVRDGGSDPRRRRPGATA